MGGSTVPSPKFHRHSASSLQFSPNPFSEVLLNKIGVLTHPISGEIKLTSGELTREIGPAVRLVSPQAVVMSRVTVKVPPGQFVSV